MSGCRMGTGEQCSSSIGVDGCSINRGVFYSMQTKCKWCIHFQEHLITFHMEPGWLLITSLGVICIRNHSSMAFHPPPPPQRKGEIWSMLCKELNGFSSQRASSSTWSQLCHDPLGTSWHSDSVTHSHRPWWHWGPQVFPLRDWALTDTLSVGVHSAKKKPT